MKVIYEPSGYAREYSPWALNYYKGCDHGCVYCYCPSITRQTKEAYASELFVRARIIPQLVSDLEEMEAAFTENKEPKQQVLLSFMGDPYCAFDDAKRVTSQVLSYFLMYKQPVAILTKGGRRLLKDLTFIERFGQNIKIGATACFHNEDDRAKYEPGAASTDERLEVLKLLHNQGIRTWLSMEPVINPTASLDILQRSVEYVDEYRLGKLNHNAKLEGEIDWGEYLREALAILRPEKKKIYVKAGLAKAAANVIVEPNERNKDLHALKGWI